MKHFCRLSATALLIGILALLPSLSWAGPFLTTGFVPELATPTVEMMYTFHNDKIDDLDLNRNVVTVRLSYVIHPALEWNIDAKVLSYAISGDYHDPKLKTTDPGYKNYDFDYGVTGAGLGMGLKYEFANLIPDFDFAVAVSGSYGSAARIQEFDVTALGLISRDIAHGFSPFAGIGWSYSNQRYFGQTKVFNYAPYDTYDTSEYEHAFLPLMFLGAKYIYQNHLSISAELFYQNGFGFEASFGYRF